MTITFDGASGTHPTIDVTGNVTGSYDVTDIPKSSPLYAEGYNLSGSLGVQGTATAATLLGWTPDSGIPMSLLNQYLNPSAYAISEQLGTGPYRASVVLPSTAEATLAVNLLAPTAAPEPAAVLVYVAAIAGLGVHRGARHWRSRTARVRPRRTRPALPLS
jgi:hypothetical protein